MKFKLFNKLVVLRSPIRTYRLPNQYTFGITNRTQDNYFVLFMDYDCVDYDVVLNDIDFLQKNYNLGTVIVRCTDEKINNVVDKVIGNYHVIGFTKYTFPEVRTLLSLSRCDEHFKTAYKYQARCWVLRIGEKYNLYSQKVDKKMGELKEIIYGKTSKVASTAFIKFFERLDNIRLQKYFKNVDNLNKVEIIYYVTQKVRHI